MEKLKKQEKVFWHNMNTRFFIIAFFSISLFSCSSSNKEEITTDDIYFDDGYNEHVRENMPKITFEEDVFNFGSILAGERIKHTYVFKNEGESDLIISSVDPSCGCTTPKGFTKEPIGPGQKGDISIEFDSTDKSGKIDKTITVYTNTSPNKSILYIKGNVVNTEKILNPKSE